MGIVIDTGSGVSLLKKGDRVVMPFNVADGRCRNCEEGKTAFCTGVNPGFAGGAYGYVAMGPYDGGQAQYLRVPYADFNCLKLPAGTEHEAGTAWFFLGSSPVNLWPCLVLDLWASWLHIQLRCAAHPTSMS
jgi:threonine dehydrogenase-like Zn-dependent dehydrogenase